jgi:putative endonuclease
MTNWKHTVLYTGVTNDLARRVLEHKSKTGGVFSRRNNLNKLVFVEMTERIEDAITREKQIKGGSRQDKINLVTSMNPDWNDLYEEYFG